MAQQRGLDQEEHDAVDERRSVRAPVVYEIIRQEGVEELERPLVSLWWSGIASGLAMSASTFSQGFFHLHLADAPWRPLIENLGYCVGFLIVILGRFQLFTEQTVKAILPLLSDQTWDNFVRTARLWIIVLIANLAGAFCAALFGTLSAGTSAAQLAAFQDLSLQFVDKGPLQLLMLGIPAGFLIAALAWLLPNAEGSKFWVILVVTYVIALGEFAHVVASAVEVFLVLIAGQITPWHAFGGVLLPALIGNILGGTALFSLIAYAQVREEI
jgi:formate/nitrite transporter FocA (FNT family)